MSKAFRFAFGIFAILIPILITGCSGGSSTVAATGPTPGRYGPLELTLTTPKTSYARGEAIPLTFTVKNTGTTAVSTTYFTSATLTIQAMLGNQIIWYIPQGGFEPKPLTYAPGETKTLDTVWMEEDLNNRPAPSGAYIISAWIPAASVDGVMFTKEEVEANLAARPIQVTLQP